MGAVGSEEGFPKLTVAVYAGDMVLPHHWHRHPSAYLLYHIAHTAHIRIGGFGGLHRGQEDDARLGEAFHQQFHAIAHALGKTQYGGGLPARYESGLYKRLFCRLAEQQGATLLEPSVVGTMIITSGAGWLPCL